jgi:predicted DNA-binding transcriptional regulator AlpA
VPTRKPDFDLITPRLLNMSQAKIHSGESRSTLYKEWKLGNLKVVKMGGSTRIELNELNRYIDAKIKASHHK